MKTMSGTAAVLVLAGVLAGTIDPVHALVANEVLSTHVKEADGTSGQNTNAGAGIKTNHLQNDAVTSVKIKDGAVTAPDIAAGAVTKAKIKDGAVTASKVAYYSRVIIVDVNGGGDFTSPVDAMTAVAKMTPAPAAGTPVLVKLMPGTYNIGTQPVVMVPYVDIEGSGEGITLVNGTVPASYPGYTAAIVGASSAQLRFLTVVNTAASSHVLGFYAPPESSPTLLHVSIAAVGSGTYTFGAYLASLSSSRLTHVGAGAMGSQKAYGIYSDSGAATFTDVSAGAVDGSVWNFGIHLAASEATTLRRVEATAIGVGAGEFSMGNVGISIVGCSPVLEEVKASASGGTFRNVGIRIEGTSEPVMTNVTASAFDAGAVGLETSASGDGTTDDFEVRVDRCTLEGASNSVFNDKEYVVRVGASKLVGGPVFTFGGTLRCVASYDANYDALLSDCSNCVPAAGFFHATGGPFGDAGSCEAAAMAQAPARCCSGSFSGFQFNPDPPACFGICD